MQNINLPHDFRSEIKESIDEIRAANDYEIAIALWREACDNLEIWHQNGVISDSVFSIYAKLLDEAIGE